MQSPQPRPASVYTIPAHACFVDVLAGYLLRRFADDPLQLSAATVVLPTRRAVRSLREAFLKVADGHALLLPRMQPIGDFDADELIFDDGGQADDLSLPPAIEPLRRHLLLMQLISRADYAETAQAAQLAAELARFFDHLHTEDLSLDDLASLAPEQFAVHWQVTLDFLHAIARPWGDILQAEGAMEPASRRIALIRSVAERWRRAPPHGPVIAAGSTGSVPATAELLKVVANLPDGIVVLPGLDQALEEEAWAALEPSHPQYGMRQLLTRIGVGRDDIAQLPGAPAPEPAASARLGLLSEAMRPATTTDLWAGLPNYSADAVRGMARIDCADPQEEARIVALLMRESLQHPRTTAALVTPDRVLARRVAAELQRWRIDVDDSAGVALTATPVGTFLRLVADALSAQAAPVPLLALLKHPFANLGGRPGTGMPTAAFKARVRRLERTALRGPRPAPGFAGLASASQGDTETASFVAELAQACAAFEALLAAPRATLTALLAAHVSLAEALSGEATGTARLWSGDAGEATAQFINEFDQAAEGLPEIDGNAYATVFTEMMRGCVVRPRYGAHPRLNIWGPLEARLQRADLLILGGLNEGTWPAETATDPWLSRPMRETVGLPSPERRIGLSAHDFTQGAGAPRVVLTRSGKVDGVPTVPSRWLLRLDTVMQGGGIAWPSQVPRDYRAWQELLDRPDAVAPIGPPTFAPPVTARPRQLSVTRIETLMRDPYALYAERILRLRALEPLDADPSAAERGSAVHQALDRFVREYPSELPADSRRHLLDLGREAFGPMLDRPGVRSFWWPRYVRIAEWFLAEETRRRRDIVPLATEVSGAMEIDAPAGPFRVTAHADRIDRLPDGQLAIIDYKTGPPPTGPAVERGDAPQLPLEAAIAAIGGFEGIGPATVGELSFWQLSGGREPGRIAKLRIDVDKAVDAAQHGLARLVATFDDPSTPYRARPRPAVVLRYNDYDHLARVREWSGFGMGEEP